MTENWETWKIEKHRLIAFFAFPLSPFLNFS